MPWRIVRQPNGLFARFSSIVDTFTDYNMTREEAVALCLEYLPKDAAEAKVQRGTDRGIEAFQDEIDTVRAVHGEEQAKTLLQEMSEEPKSMKLFLSFTTLLDTFIDGDITEHDINTGIFALGATRQRVIDMQERALQIERQRHKECIYVWGYTIVPLLLRAEQEERVLWRPIDRNPTFHEFQEFCGHFNIIVPQELFPYYPSYPSTKKILAPINPGLEIIA